MIRNTQNKQQGAAAIFIVLFFALLVGVITLSFITIVGQDQQQAINNDLSQSAYDSAEAGVEDGKRALEVYRRCPDAVCRKEFEDNSFVHPGSPTDNTCHSIANISSKIGVTVDAGNDPEVKLSRGTNDNKLNQAYSCASIATQTPDFVYTQEANKVDLLVPLKPAPGQQVTNFDINWFNKNKDASSANVAAPLTFHGYPDIAKNANDWGELTPSLLRVQLIKVAKNNIMLDDIDRDSVAAFLYPSSVGGTNNIANMVGVDTGRNQPKPSQPVQVRCANSTYACTVNIGSIDTNAADYYLRVIPIYNKATYRVQMKDSGGTVVNFDNVQPSIDVTGRASNLFRRIQTRVTYDSEMSMPLGGYDSTQGICKDFSVSTLPTDFDEGPCTP